MCRAAGVVLKSRTRRHSWCGQEAQTPLTTSTGETSSSVQKDEVQERCIMLAHQWFETVSWHWEHGVRDEKLWE